MVEALRTPVGLQLKQVQVAGARRRSPRAQHRFDVARVGEERQAGRCADTAIDPSNTRVNGPFVDAQLTQAEPEGRLDDDLYTPLVASGRHVADRCQLYACRVHKWHHQEPGARVQVVDGECLHTVAVCDVGGFRQELGPAANGDAIAFVEQA